EDRLVIVAVNQGTSTIEKSFRFEGLEPITVTPWLTSSEVTLREQPRQIVKSPFTYSFGDSSITALVLALEAETIGAGGAPPQSEGGAGGAEPEPEPSDTGSGGSGGTRSADSSSTGGNGATGGTKPGTSTSKGRPPAGTEPPYDRLGKGPYSCGCDVPGHADANPLLLALLFGAAVGARRQRAQSS